MRARLVLLACVVPMAILAPPAGAQEATTATMNVTVSSMAKLTVSAATLTFPDANPDLSPQVTPLQGALTISAKARSTEGSQVVLTVQAADDLRSGLEMIPASAMSWTVTGSGFAPGTLSKVSPVTLGQWNGSGARTGTQTFLFQNLWTYASGTYTATLTYTLSAP